MSNPGRSETMIEMGAEIHDPALWAAMQLTKPAAIPPATVGEVFDRVREIMDAAIGMEGRRRHAALAKAVDDLPAQVAEQAGEIERLRAIVERLPKLGCGGRAVPGQVVYVNTDTLPMELDSVKRMGIVEATVECDTFNGGFDMGGDVGSESWAVCFDYLEEDGGRVYQYLDIECGHSTREAAEAAR